MEIFSFQVRNKGRKPPVSIFTEHISMPEVLGLILSRKKKGDEVKWSLFIENMIFHVESPKDPTQHLLNEK